MVEKTLEEFKAEIRDIEESFVMLIRDFEADNEVNIVDILLDRKETRELSNIKITVVEPTTIVEDT